MDVPGSRCTRAGRLESYRREDEAMYREWNHLYGQIDRVRKWRALIIVSQAVGFVRAYYDLQRLWIAVGITIQAKAVLAIEKYVLTLYQNTLRSKQVSQVLKKT